MLTKRKFARKFLQYASISIEPIAILGVVLCYALTCIPGVDALVPYLAWPVGAAFVIFFLQVLIVRLLSPTRLFGVVRRSHIRKLYFGRCATGRVFLGTRDIKQEQVNVTRIKCGSRIYRVIIDAAQLIPPGTQIGLEFSTWDAFVRLAIYRIVPVTTPAK